VTTTDIELIPPTARERWELCESLAGSHNLPADFRSAKDLFYASEYGAMLRLPVIAAAVGIHVIKGKPSCSVALMSALVTSKGHKIRTTLTGTVAAGDIKARTVLIRADDPGFEHVSEWDLDRAVRAELIDELRVTQDGKTLVWSRTEKGEASSWQKWTEAMLKARTKSEACRDGAEDALFGLHYTPEELGADVDESGEPVDITASVVDVTPARPAPTGKVHDGDPDGKVRAAYERKAAEAKQQTPAQPEPAPQAAPQAAPADHTTAVAVVPAGQPTAAQQEAAEAIAVTVTLSANPEQLRDAYRRLTGEGLKNIDVSAVVEPDWCRVIGIEHKTPFTLGSWVMKVGAWVGGSGGLSIVASLALEDTDDSETGDGDSETGDGDPADGSFAETQD
jgi:hypothetical protein